MQERKQDTCSTGYIQQAWGAELSLGMIGNSLDIESGKRFDQRPLGKVLVALIIGSGSFSSIIGTHGSSLFVSPAACLGALGCSVLLACTMRKGCSPPPSRRRDTISNPCSMRIRSVSRFQWQFPRQRVVSGTSASWTHAVMRAFARTCSRSNKLPPGLSVRQISRRLHSGSRTEHKTRVTTTLSKWASGNGSISPVAFCRDQHRLIWLDGLHRHDAASIIKREVLTATGSHFQDHSVRLSNDLTP